MRKNRSFCFVFVREIPGLRQWCQKREVFMDSRQTILFGIQAATLAASLQAQAAVPESRDIHSDTDQAAINQFSLKSIEESWLRVPRACKAVTFNAEPVFTQEARKAEINSLYSSLV
jgi:hypothetical protein